MENCALRRISLIRCQQCLSVYFCVFVYFCLQLCELFAFVNWLLLPFSLSIVTVVSCVHYTALHSFDQSRIWFAVLCTLSSDMSGAPSPNQMQLQLLLHCTIWHTHTCLFCLSQTHWKKVVHINRKYFGRHVCSCTCISCNLCGPPLLLQVTLKGNNPVQNCPYDSRAHDCSL